MTQYARITGGTVVELFTPPDGVELGDCFHVDLISQFAAIPVGVTPVPGWRYGSGSFTPPPAPPPPTPAQRATAMLSGGIEIVCTSAPALSGTYAVDPGFYQRITGVVAAIAGGLGLPGGGATFDWFDTSGTAHQFAATQFTAFARAVMDFEYALNNIIGSNAGTLPALPVTIP